MSNPVLIPMTAEALVKEMDDALVGRTILTQKYGDWPGGFAVVKQLRPDHNAPDIVFEVLGTDHRVNRAILNGRLESSVIGVLDHEEVQLMPFSRK